MEVPDLRIVDKELAHRLDEELRGRSMPQGSRGGANGTRTRHLLSGLIRSDRCGGNFNIVGGDYDRCASNRERGTCTNRASVRATVVERAALDALQSRLLTQEHAEIFAREFAREVERLTRTREERDDGLRERAKVLDVEIENLSRNLLAGVISTTLSRMLAEREAEREEVERQLTARLPQASAVLPHPQLIRLYERKVAEIRSALNDPAVRDEAAQTLRSLVASVTIDEEDGAIRADVEASAATLIDFAQTKNSPRSVTEGSSIVVVAGAGFEPATFRL